MELLILWCDAQSARERLRNTFKESGKPNKEVTLNSPIKVGTPSPHRLPIDQTEP
jgi:hypothetical protein